MTNTKNTTIMSQRAMLVLCILCAAALSIVGVYHLIAFNRPWDYFDAAGSIMLMFALLSVYRESR